MLVLPWPYLTLLSAGYVLALSYGQLTAQASIAIILDGYSTDSRLPRSSRAGHAPARRPPRGGVTRTSHRLSRRHATGSSRLAGVALARASFHPSRRPAVGARSTSACSGPRSERPWTLERRVLQPGCYSKTVRGFPDFFANLKVRINA